MVVVDFNLITKINGRRVIVDACVSRNTASQLKYMGFIVRHVADINTTLKDIEIAKMMYVDEVLITRDYGFYKTLGEARAILLAPRSETMITGDKRMKKKYKLPSHIRIALREKLAEEAKSGLLYMKIFWGIMWLVLPVI